MMNEEELREMARSNYAAQMETLGYGPDGMPAVRDPQPGALAPYIENFGKYLVQMAQMVQELNLHGTCAIYCPGQITPDSSTVNPRPDPLAADQQPDQDSDKTEQ